MYVQQPYVNIHNQMKVNTTLLSFYLTCPQSLLQWCQGSPVVEVVLSSISNFLTSPLEKKKLEILWMKVYRLDQDLCKSWLRKMGAQQDSTVPVKQPEEMGCCNWPKLFPLMCAQDNCVAKRSGLLISAGDTWACMHTYVAHPLQ